MSRTKFYTRKSKAKKDYATWFSKNNHFYFALFSLFPIIFIYSTNLKEVALTETFWPLIISLVSSLITFFILRGLLKSSHKAAFLTTAILTVFFSYGHVFTLIEGLKIFGFQIGRNMFLLPFVVFLLLGSFVFVWRTKKIFSRLTSFLSIVGLILLFIQIFNIGIYAANNGLRFSDTPLGKTFKNNERTPPEETYPDIYYIILDGYARNSTLKKVQDYDNREFTNYLKGEGFFVTEKSRSNYALTFLSLGSSLNMKHLTYLPEAAKKGELKTNYNFDLIRNNEVSKFLKTKGYLYINIGTGWGVTNQNEYAHKSFYYKQRNEFIKLLFETTLLRLVEKYQNDAANSILFAFDTLKTIPNIKNPTLTLTHIISPHPPFLFTKEGRFVPLTNKSLRDNASWLPKESYIDQIVFINKKARETVDIILAKSEKPPIIILQSDHGSASSKQMISDLNTLTNDQLDERMDILNAYYFPNKGDKVLYPSITPVNTFRKLFNFYFKTNYPMLDDTSYFSTQKNRYEFIKVPNED